MRDKLPYINCLAYIGLIIINILALQLPFFGITPGDVSDLYPNLLTPADFTFKIWSVIYVSLGIFTYYQLNIYRKNKLELPKEVSAIGSLFAISSLLNFLWLITWQSLHITTSFIMIFVLWIILIIINYRLSILRNTKWYYTIPFSFYLGWISISALANLNVLFIDLDLNFFGFKEEYWTSSLIILGIFGTLLALYLNKDIWFTMILIWAFYGVYSKNILLAPTGNWVTLSTLVAIYVLMTVGLIVGFRSWKSTRELSKE